MFNVRGFLILGLLAFTLFPPLDIPKCGNHRQQYNAGYNQTVIMECLIIDANPNVTSYQLIGPTDTSSIEQIIENGKQTGRFKVKPRTRYDFGPYECFPRNSAGSTTCSFTLILDNKQNNDSRLIEPINDMDTALIDYGTALLRSVKYIFDITAVELRPFLANFKNFDRKLLFGPKLLAV